MPRAASVRCVVAALLLCQPDGDAGAWTAKGEKPIRVLLLAGNDAHKWHHWEKTTPRIREALERDGRVRVEGITDFEELAKRKLADYHVLLLNSYCNWHDPKGPSAKSKSALVRYLREFGADNVEDYQVGQVLTADIFVAGQIVDVTGTSKGRGFQGVIKRHGFHGGPKTHGQSDRWRAPGSIGAGTDPGRVWKGTRMAGRMGNARVTVQNLEVVEVLADRHLLLVKGSVPGAKNGLLMVRRAVKAGK